MTETEEEWHDRMHREVVTHHLGSDKSSKELVDIHVAKLVKWFEENPPPEKCEDYD